MKAALAIALAVSLPASALPDEPTPFWAAPETDTSPLVAPPVQKPKKKKKPSKAKPKPKPAERTRADDEAEAVLRSIEEQRRSERRARSEPALPPLIAPAPKPAEPEPKLVLPEPLPPPRPAEPPPAPERTVATPVDEVQLAEPKPRPAPQAVAIEVRPPVVAPGAREEAVAEAERPPQLAGRRPRNFDVSVLGFGALWTTSATAGGRAWDPALGVRIATVLPSAWSAELYAARSGASGGTAFASTSTTRLLAGARAGRWLYEGGLLGVQLAGGAAATLSSTKYGARDVAGDPQALEGSSGLKVAPEVGATLRLRPLKFLELRIDASALYRDARLEGLLGLSGGAWVAF